ncbi:MAG: TadE/TadG family type IV pilus assembly protein [Rhodospirillaceae bacterium]
MTKRLVTDAHGNVAIEFALLMPFFALMIMGLAELGFMTLERSTLDAAARSGLQVILADPADTAQAETLAQDIAPDADIDASVACECPDGTATACNTTCSGELPLRFVTVTATEDWPLLFPWPGIDDPFPLQAMAEGRTQ